MSVAARGRRGGPLVALWWLLGGPAIAAQAPGALGRYSPASQHLGHKMRKKCQAVRPAHVLSVTSPCSTLSPSIMATIRSVLGKFNGTMADVTFSNWKGQNVVKQKVPDTNSSSSPAQILQRAKFALLAIVSGTLGNATRVGFKMSAVDKTEQNVFQSRNFKLVSTDPQGNVLIDYPSILVAEGPVATMAAPNIGKGSQPYTVDVKWQDNSNGTTALPSDILVIGYVNTANGLGGAFVTSVTRADGAQGTTFGVKNTQIGERILVYPFFKRAASTLAGYNVSVDVTL